MVVCRRSLLLFVLASLCAGCGPPPEKEVLDPRRQFEPGPVDAAAPEEFTTTNSGLKYRVRRNSAERKPISNDVVTVHYKGWFDDGQVFDTSFTTGYEKTFEVKEVIRGWQEGLLLLGLGGMIELEVPPHLAYGTDGNQELGIPPEATLHFLIELIEIQGSPYPDLPDDEDLPGAKDSAGDEDRGNDKTDDAE